MLPNFLFNCIIVEIVLVLLCTSWAYYVDAKRPDDDPKKKNYHPTAILLAPVTFPILFVLSISFFFLRVLAHGVFLVLFIFALIFVRKPFILEWLQKTPLKVGDRLLEANMLVVRFFLGPRRNYQRSA